PAALDRHRDLDHRLLGRRCHRPDAGRGAAGAVLVGLGVPVGGAGDGVAAGAGPALACRIPRPWRRPAGFGPAGPAAGGGAGGGVGVVGVVGVGFGMKEGAGSRVSWAAAAAILGGLAVGVGFARRQLTLADPMIDLRLFRSRAFNASLATNLLGIFIVVGYFL